MHLRWHTGALAAEQQRVARHEREAVERDAARCRQQDKPRIGLPRGDERGPGRVPRHRGECGIIERRALQPAVVEQEAQRLDEVDRDAETGGQAQQRAGILWNVRLIESEAQREFPEWLKKMSRAASADRV